MLDLLRRMVAICMVIVAVVGLLPLVPLVFGFYSATVTSGIDGLPANQGTYYPTTSDLPFIYCVQAPLNNQMDDGSTYANTAFFKCTNRWGSDVRITAISSDLKGLSITGMPVTLKADGVHRCIQVTILATAKTSKATDVVYTAEFESATGDLSGTIQFHGVLNVKNNETPAWCQ